jgi:hypothetical protein
VVLGRTRARRNGVKGLTQPSGYWARALLVCLGPVSASHREGRCAAHGMTICWKDCHPGRSVSVELRTQPTGKKVIPAPNASSNIAPLSSCGGRCLRGVLFIGVGCRPGIQTHSVYPGAQRSLFFYFARLIHVLADRPSHDQALFSLAWLIHVLADRRSHDQARGVQLQRPCRVEGGAYAKIRGAGRRLGATEGFLGLVVAAVRKIPLNAPYNLRKTARVPIATFVGVALSLGSNVAIVKDTSHAMSLVWL